MGTNLEYFSFFSKLNPEQFNGFRKEIKKIGKI